MKTTDLQLAYWDRIGPTKTFAHPVDLDRLNEYLEPNARILDFGCGYGRVLGVLSAHGYDNLVGVDPALAMIAAARERFPTIEFNHLSDPPHVDAQDASVDAVLLISVLTCVPGDDAQRGIVGEASRVLRAGGLLYISDMWLQSDSRNIERYEACRDKYGVYGVFDLPEGVTVRHHDGRWIAELTGGYEQAALNEIQVQTMNGHAANAFQWFGRKR